MASLSATFRAPVLLRPRNFRWCVNSASGSEKEEWQTYSDIENEIIEDAHNERKAEVEIDGDYVIDFGRNVQYKKGDQNRLTVKRVELKNDRNYVYFRQERFSSPLEINNSACSLLPLSNDKEDCYMEQYRTDGDLRSAYWSLELNGKDRTVADIVEDAAQGIVKEGTACGKAREAQWIAQQLLAMKQSGADIKAEEYDTFIPPDIGQTCVYLYTKESFWYKLHNHVLRDRKMVTREHVKTLFPFSWLLYRYLRLNWKEGGFTKLWRGLNLTDEERKEFIRKNRNLRITSFSSTSKSRQVAEIFSANTLFIFCISSESDPAMDNFPAPMGADISYLSAIPDEEEFLIWPYTSFSFIKYEYDDNKKKHMLYFANRDDCRIGDMPIGAWYYAS